MSQVFCSHVGAHGICSGPQKYNRENPVCLLHSKNYIPQKFPRIWYCVAKKHGIIVRSDDAFIGIHGKEL